MKNRGRPKKMLRKDKAIIARVPEDLWEFVMHYTISNKTTMTSIVEKMLADWRKRIEHKKLKNVVD